jgi:hypothetical protein
LFECAGDVGTFVPGDLQGSLKNICIKTDGLRVKQEDAVVTDDLSVKSHLSRALAAIFPNCEKKRVLCEHKQIYSFYMCKG